MELNVSRHPTSDHLVMVEFSDEITKGNTSNTQIVSPIEKNCHWDEDNKPESY